MWERASRRRRAPERGNSGECEAGATDTRRAAGLSKHILLLGSVALLLLVAACASAPDLPQCARLAAAPASPDGYELGPGDELEVTVYRHENLSGQYALDASGSVALPLVGDIAASGLTARELESRIEQELRRDRYLVDPRVSTEVLTHRPIYVLGEVRQPGEYEYVAGMNVVNAVALAGGYTYRADPESITVARDDCFRYATPATAVGPGEVVQVPERFF